MRPGIIAALLLGIWSTGNTAELVAESMDVMEVDPEVLPTMEECAMANKLGDDFLEEALTLAVEKKLEEQK